MESVVNINIDEIDAQFIEKLKRDFAHADVEIRLQDYPDQYLSFTETDFWSAINLLNWSEVPNDEKVVRPLIDALAEKPIPAIYRFSDILAEKLWLLDTYRHAKVFLDNPDEGGVLSVDDFLYARCAVVANGQTYYEKILENPQLMPSDSGFEPLLYVALSAYKLKTGKNFTPFYAFNYETYSNKKGWQIQDG